MNNQTLLPHPQLSALSVVLPANTAAVLHQASLHTLRLVPPPPLQLSVHHFFSVHPATVQSVHWNEGWFNNYE